ncbi:GerAB/ArcD/ProY family transporter [Niallia endozanthoxylica]|uniref:GerAB/ArcD/ProY family transporter n=1 Tax=Niallia endozanthoxylica TaxID=2036016 RepID=A0A5J5I4L9_9BACI|nr:GerAB/ArcD/ProY family transporter [Niallia endozanthoxylica]KAA9028544.1 GerAB/ArcD/ProY family transporter [Niallia endozanthoxylica]
MMKITKTQLFSLIMLFEIGSTTLFVLGIEAKQDAWIVVFLSSLVGLLLLWVYTQFPKHFPNQNFAEILTQLVGKKFAALLLLLFGLSFLSGASHNFYEFGQLIKMTALPTTPLLVILYIFIIASIYILNFGFEVLARTAEILFPVFLIFLLTIYIITLLSGNFQISEMLPILGNGLSPILSETPKVISFPYGEMVVFLIYWHYVDKQQDIKKIAITALIFSTIAIILTLIAIISVLGVNLAANAEIPLLETILTVNIADIFTNLDLLAVLIMFIGGFYKMSLRFYAFVLILTWLFKAKSPKKILIISGLLFPLFTVYRFPGLDYKRWKGDIELNVVLLYALIPILLLMIHYLKKRKHHKSQEERSNVSH